MKIIWLGHGSFRFEIGGQVILLDPWLTGNPVLPAEMHDAAVSGATHILLTHGHGDHSTDCVRLSKELGVPVVGQYDVMSHWADAEGIDTVGFNKGGTVNLNGIKVTMVNALHSSSFGSPDGPRFAGSECGFVIEGDGHSIYASGDTDVMSDMQIINDLHAPDIGILSAGGHFTMDMRRTAYAAKRFFDFKTLIPAHYRTFPILEQNADLLKRELPGVQVIEPEVMAAIDFD